MCACVCVVRICQFIAHTSALECQPHLRVCLLWAKFLCSFGWLWLLHVWQKLLNPCGFLEQLAKAFRQQHIKAIVIAICCCCCSWPCKPHSKTISGIFSCLNPLSCPGPQLSAQCWPQIAFGAAVAATATATGSGSGSGLQVNVTVFKYLHRPLPAFASIVVFMTPRDARIPFSCTRPVSCLTAIADAAVDAAAGLRLYCRTLMQPAELHSRRRLQINYRLIVLLLARWCCSSCLGWHQCCRHRRCCCCCCFILHFSFIKQIRSVFSFVRLSWRLLMYAINIEQGATATHLKRFRWQLQELSPGYWALRASDRSKKVLYTEHIR